MLGLCWVLLSCLGPMLDFVGLSLAHLGTMLPPGVALGLCSLYFRFMLDHLETMLGLCWVLLGQMPLPVTQLFANLVLAGVLVVLLVVLVSVLVVLEVVVLLRLLMLLVLFFAVRLAIC